MSWAVVERVTLCGTRFRAWVGIRLRVGVLLDQLLLLLGQWSKHGSCSLASIKKARICLSLCLTHSQEKVVWVNVNNLWLSNSGV